MSKLRSATLYFLLELPLLELLLQPLGDQLLGELLRVRVRVRVRQRTQRELLGELLRVRVRVRVRQRVK